MLLINAKLALAILLMAYLAAIIYLMNRTMVERNVVVLLFLFVLILFSFAQKDTQKLEKLYTEKAKIKTGDKLSFAKNLTPVGQ